MSTPITQGKRLNARRVSSSLRVSSRLSGVSTATPLQPPRPLQGLYLCELSPELLQHVVPKMKPAEVKRLGVEFEETLSEFKCGPMITKEMMRCLSRFSEKGAVNFKELTKTIQLVLQRYVGHRGSACMRTCLHAIYKY